MDALLVVTPYYVSPTGAGSWRTTRRSPRPPTCRSWPTTSRAARRSDMPNDLLAELGQIDNIVGGQAGALRGPRADRRAGPARRQRRHARRGHGHRRHRRHPGGLAPRRPRDAPDHRRARAPPRDRGRRCATSTRRSRVTANPIPVKTAMQHARPRRRRRCGCRSWRPREDERAVIRAALERHEPAGRGLSPTARCGSCRSAGSARSART